MKNKVLFHCSNTCTDHSDCEEIPNTKCLREDEPNIMTGTTLRLLTCECADGFEPIPDPYRMIGEGCYDPIGRTVTVNARSEWLSNLSTERSEVFPKNV